MTDARGASINELQHSITRISNTWITSWISSSLKSDFNQSYYNLDLLHRRVRKESVQDCLHLIFTNEFTTSYVKIQNNKFLFYYIYRKL